MPRPFPPLESIPLAEQRGQSFPRLVELMQRLLADDGCPWDREQTFESLRRYVVEEAHEVVDAIDGGDRDELRTELGDLLLQVVFQAELGRAEGRFGPDDVVGAIVDKIVRRHPHVFADEKAETAKDVLESWEQLKAREKGAKGLLGGIPRSMPALLRAQRIGEKVEKVGFDWPDTKGSRAKVAEEMGELDAAIASGDRAHIEEELGDALFAREPVAPPRDRRRGGPPRHDRQVHRPLRARREARHREPRRLAEGVRRHHPARRARRALGRGQAPVPRGQMKPVLPLHPVARLPEDWAKALAARGERPFRAAQVFKWVHARGVVDPELMTDLPATLRAALKEEGLGPTTMTSEVRTSADGTRKLLVRMGDGATVESVLIPGVSGANRAADEDADAAVADDDEDEEEGPAPVRRVTQCISTQVGCAMGCVFCASGVAGLKRHLATEEIVGQVLLGRSMLREGEQLRNVVLMGMGEPLHNYDATARALRLLSHPDGISLSTRRVTVSTSGLVPEIDRLGADFGGQVALAISLHATDDETRSRLMPINKKYPLAELLAALKRYPLPKRRRITIEYTLVAGKNDTVVEARKLAKLLRDLKVKVNLIPMNPIDASTLGPTSLDGVLAFQRVLIDAGYSCFVRRRRGDDVAAACGQLALRGAKPKVRVDRS
jgi:23S rRNA (adenine2503-C2)-methyltransferase